MKISDQQQPPLCYQRHHCFPPLSVDNNIKSHPATATPQHTIIKLALDQKSKVSVIIP